MNELRFGINLDAWLTRCGISSENTKNQVKKNIKKTQEELSKIWFQKDALSLSPEIDEIKTKIDNFYSKK